MSPSKLPPEDRSLDWNPAGTADFAGWTCTKGEDVKLAANQDQKNILVAKGYSCVLTPKGHS